MHYWTVKTLMTNHSYYTIEVYVYLLYNSNNNYYEVLSFRPNKYLQFFYATLPQGFLDFVFC